MWCEAELPRIEAEGALFSPQDYLDCVLDGQNEERVQEREEADVVLTMGKGLLDNSITWWTAISFWNVEKIYLRRIQIDPPLFCH